MRITREISTYWEDWYFDAQGNLRDPEGNADRPEDLRASWSGRQLYEELAGTQAQVCSLKQRLQQALEAAERRQPRCPFLPASFFLDAGEGGSERVKSK